MYRAWILLFLWKNSVSASEKRTTQLRNICCFKVKQVSWEKPSASASLSAAGRHLSPPPPSVRWFLHGFAYAVLFVSCVCWCISHALICFLVADLNGLRPVCGEEGDHGVPTRYDRAELWGLPAGQQCPQKFACSTWIKWCVISRRLCPKPKSCNVSSSSKGQLTVHKKCIILIVKCGDGGSCWYLVPNIRISCFLTGWHWCWANFGTTNCYAIAKKRKSQ